MVVVEVGMRIISAVFSKEGFACVIGALFASFLMLHSAGYHHFILEVNRYALDTYYLLLGTSR